MGSSNINPCSRRRSWATALLHDFTPTYSPSGPIPFVNDYTPCTVTFTLSPLMRGQILAGQGIQGTDSSTLNFTQLDSRVLPGTMGAPLPMVTVANKTARNG